MVPTPILFYPFAKTLWLAVDLFFRPPGPGDFAGDPAGRSREATRGRRS